MDLKTKDSCFMEDLYRRHERLMYFIAGKYTANAQKREDIVQTAVVSLLRKEATLRRLPPYAQINYIAAAVRNTAINALKREQKELDRYISLEDLTETFPTQFMPSAEAIRAEDMSNDAVLFSFIISPCYRGLFGSKAFRCLRTPQTGD